jgi:hypothetical protein
MSLMIERALSDRLLDTSSYIELTAKVAQQINKASFRLILCSMVDDHHHLDPSTIQYFTRTLCTRRDNKTGKVIQPDHFHLPYFYILPKVHKSTWKTRPVVRALAPVPKSLSKWINLHLQQVIHLCPDYLRDVIFAPMVFFLLILLYSQLTLCPYTPISTRTTPSRFSSSGSASMLWSSHLDIPSLRF